jgi:pimeloyl-ACP methyl ester carboxylesterase
MIAAPPTDLAGWSVPTWFVVGEHDALTVPWLIEATASAVPGARLVTIAGAGHSPNIECAEACNQVLAGVLAELATRRS